MFVDAWDDSNMDDNQFKYFYNFFKINIDLMKQIDELEINSINLNRIGVIYKNNALR